MMRHKGYLYANTRVRARVMDLGSVMEEKPIKLTCGAKTRIGTPCKNTRIFKNGRCKNHGGLSTGPLTEQGKARVSANLEKHKTNILQQP